MNIHELSRRVQQLVPGAVARPIASGGAGPDVAVLASQHTPHLSCTVQLFSSGLTAVITFGGTATILSGHAGSETHDLVHVTAAILQGNVRVLCAVDGSSARIVGSRTWGEWGERTYLPDPHLDPREQLVELQLGGP
jgi:hypothetical protein